MGRLSWARQSPCSAQQRCWLPAPQRQYHIAVRSQPTFRARQPARCPMPSSQARLGDLFCGSTAAPSSLRLPRQPWRRSQPWHGIAPLWTAADSGPSLTTSLTNGKLLEAHAWCSSSTALSKPSLLPNRPATVLVGRSIIRSTFAGTSGYSVTKADAAQQDRLGDADRDSRLDSGCSEEGGREISSSSGEQSDSTVASVPLSRPRRSLQLQFTCGKCGVRGWRASQLDASSVGSMLTCSWFPAHHTALESLPTVSRRV